MVEAAWLSTSILFCVAQALSEDEKYNVRRGPDLPKHETRPCLFCFCFSF